MNELIMPHNAGVKRVLEGLNKSIGIENYVAHRLERLIRCAQMLTAQFV